VSNEIFAKKATWKRLFEKHTFFTEGYKYYLSIISGSRSKEAQQMWSGLVQSKVRRLVGEIENSDSGVALAHPYVKGFDRVHECNTEEEVDMILHGDLQFRLKEKTTEGISSTTQAAAGLKGSEAENVPVPVNITTTEDGKIQVFTTTYYIGLELSEDQGSTISPLHIATYSFIQSRKSSTSPIRSPFSRICALPGSNSTRRSALCAPYT
jgi:poly(A) polymerase